MIAPQGYKIGPTGLDLEPPAGARNRRNASVKIRRNPPHHQIDQVKKKYSDDL